MPSKKVKLSKASKARKGRVVKSKQLSNTKQTIMDILNQFSVSRNNITKSNNNLPARLMRMKSSRYSKQKTLHQNQLNYPTTEPDMFSKSISSSFSSVMKDGHTHSTGKTIINNSTEPFLKIKEMENGNVKQFIVPKNTIPYKLNIMVSSQNNKLQASKHQKKSKGQGKKSKGQGKKSKKSKKSKY